MSKQKTRPATALLLVLSALLLLPAASQAAQVFGSGFHNEPSQPDCENFQPCTVVGLVEHPAGGGLTEAGSPIDGVITKFRIWAKTENPMAVTLRVAGVKLGTEGHKSAFATASAGGQPVTLGSTKKEEEDGDPVRIQEFAGRLPIKRGQHLGLDAPGELMATYDSGGDEFTYEYPLLNGTETLSGKALGELLVQATVEPDLDGDGFGDETQDQCPSQKATHGPCEAVKPPPVMLAATKFRVRAGKVSYELSEAASVRFSLARKGKHGFRSAGGFSGSGIAGPNQVRLPHAAKLAPGLYRLTLTATDATGGTTSAKTVFRIKR